MGDIIKGIVFLILLFALAATCPTKSDHCHAIYNSVRESVDNPWGKLAVSFVEGTTSDDDLCQALDIEFKNFWIFSTMIRKDASDKGIVSIGVFKNVWIL